MKMSHKFLVLSLLTLVLAGCSSCPCKKKECPMMEASAPVAVAPVQAVAPATTQVVEEAAPVVQEPVQKKIPAAVLK